MNQSRQNQRSTRTQPRGTFTPPSLTPASSTSLDDAFPTAPSPFERTHHCYTAIIEPAGQTCSDQTGRFIQPSSTGNNCMFVMYDYDSNCIFAEPFPNRTAACIVASFTKVHTTLCKAGFRPQLHKLDNECDASLKDFFVKEDIAFQLIPPHTHRRNAAEHAIQTFKNHFIAGLCSCDPDFPVHLWDRLLSQALLSLNLLRASRVNS